MRLTAFQAESLGKVATSYMANSVDIFEKPFDLPNGYISFCLSDEHDKTLLAGGIGPEGNVHT